MSEPLKTVAISKETHKELIEYCESHGIIARYALNAAVSDWLVSRKTYDAQHPSRPSGKAK